eukprot:14121340-Ditylum_brightwellii.AAC.1
MSITFAQIPAYRDRYREILKEHISQHETIEKVAKLYNKIKSVNYNLNMVIDQYEMLDKQITEMMLGAEKKCSRSKTGHMWSIILVQERALIVSISAGYRSDN